MHNWKSQNVLQEMINPNHVETVRQNAEKRALRGILVWNKVLPTKTSDLFGADKYVHPRMNMYIGKHVFLYRTMTIG